MIYRFDFANQRSSSGGGCNLGCLLFAAAFIVLTYYALKGLYWLLFWTSPVLLAAALLINWRSVLAAGKNYVALLEKNPVGGLFAGALIVLGFPFVALFLFLNALGGKRAEAMQQAFEQHMGNRPENTEYVDYEEVEQEEPLPPTPLEPSTLPEKEAPKKPGDNPYDEFFK